MMLPLLLYICIFLKSNIYLEKSKENKFRLSSVLSPIQKIKTNENNNTSKLELIDEGQRNETK